MSPDIVTFALIVCTLAAAGMGKAEMTIAFMIATASFAAGVSIFGAL